MKKEPIGLYIFRFTLGLGLFAFMAMLYWSSVLVEDDLRSLRHEVNELQNDVQDMRLELMQAIMDDKIEQRELIQMLGRRPSGAEGMMAIPIASQSSSRGQMDPNLPNLLTEDKFYAETLKTLLPTGFKPKGTRRSAIVGKPDHLHPFSNWSNVSSWQSMCLPTVAQMHFGIYETLAPGMAIKMEQREVSSTGETEFWVHLRDKVYWEPLNPEHFPEEVVLASHFLRKHKVTAHDFKFYFDAVMNPHVQEGGAASLRNYLGDIIEFRVIDDLTFTVRWKAQEGKIKYSAKGLTGSLKPLAAWVFKYFSDGEKIVEDDSNPETYRQDSVWAQNFAQHWARSIIVSCGPWLFDGMTDKRIRFKRNSNFYEPLAVLVDSYEIRFRESPDAIWQDFKAGKLDTHVLSPDQLIELEEFLASDEYQDQSEKGNAVHRLDFISRAYNYVGWNQATPYFASKKVRQAMTLAIDRQRIVEQNLNRMGIELTGPFHPFSPSYNDAIKPWPFAVQEAERLLEEDGWYDRDGSGVRSKVIDGKQVPFKFNLTYYVKNPTSKANCDYIATALKELGIEANLNGVDIADISATFDEKSFDALYLGWALGSPPEEPKQLWHSAGAKEKGSSNSIGFANSEADQIIEELQYEYDISKRVALYHRFHEIIHDEAPYTFLYSPKSAMLYRNRVQNVWIPAERQDLIPGANVAEPNSGIFWLKTKS